MLKNRSVHFEYYGFYYVINITYCKIHLYRFTNKILKIKHLTGNITNKYIYYKYTKD